MTTDKPEAVMSTDDLRYAKLAVRSRAAIYDTMLFFLLLFVTITLAISSGTDSVSGMIGLLAVLLFLLYDPVMVWAKGGTIGHIICNLRVVDERTQGNPSLPKATIRFVIKTVLGLYSFLAMMASRRHRALHDVFTGSTVQIRDMARLNRRDFASALTEPVGHKLPSSPLRVFAIVLYTFLSFVALSLAIIPLLRFGLFTTACLDYDRCSGVEQGLTLAIGLGWLISLFVIIWLGWRGRLFGFRSRRIEE